MRCLGLGQREHRAGRWAQLVEIANAAPRAPAALRLIFLPASTATAGESHELCFRADATVTMVAAKAGFVAPQARPFVGRVVAVVDIGVPRELIHRPPRISTRAIDS